MFSFVNEKLIKKYNQLKLFLLKESDSIKVKKQI
jgi:hypothetical protein